jgi:short-subunit dehydrogenase
MPMDITSDRSSLRELKKRLSEAGKVGILINNAGHLVNKPFLEHSEEDIADRWLSTSPRPR